MPICSRLSLALLAALALPLPAIAETASDARKLDAVEVEGRTQPGRSLHRKARAATRLDLSALEVPASVDVIDQATLRERGEVTAAEALENAPGLVPAMSFGVLNIAGRGFSGVFNSPTLYDGIRYPGWQVTPRVTLNYAQLEVLRGPAAITAGQGSIAGAINLVPRRADGKRETQVYLGLGRYATRTGAVGHGGSLPGDALRYRVDASYQAANRGSFGFAEHTGFDVFHLNGELALPVNEALTLSLAAEHYDDQAEGYFGTPLVNGRLDERLREINYNVENDYTNMRGSWLRARAEWSPDDANSARLIAFANHEDRGYRNTEVYTYQPTSGRVRRGDFLHIAHDQDLVGLYADFSHRHTLGSLPHQWVIGLQADRNDHDRYSDSPFRYTDLVDLIPADRGQYISLDPYGLRTATDIEQRSVFAESALDLSDRLKLVSGVRQDRSEVDSFNALSQMRFDKTYDATSWRTGLVWNVSESWVLYGSLATSTEPPAQITTLGLANAGFDLTDSDQIEIGAKGSASWGEWTLAAYDISRTNLLSRDPLDPNRLLQIGEQVAQGVEASLRLDLSERLRLEASGSVLDAEFARFDERVGTGLVSRAGNVPTAVPERMGTAWLHFQALDSLQLSLGARGVGRSPANTANTLWLPGYATVDLGARWESAAGTFGLRVRNVADRFYATRPYGASQFMTGEPRWFELTWQRVF